MLIINLALVGFLCEIVILAHGYEQDKVTFLSPHCGELMIPNNISQKKLNITWHAYIKIIHLLSADKMPCVLKILSLDDYNNADFYRRVYEYTTGSFSGFLLTILCTVGAGVLSRG